VRALVVEDDPVVGPDLAKRADRGGVRGRPGRATARTPISRASVEDYAVVVLDLGLPRLDGLSVLRRWRAEGRAFPVLILSARGDWTEKVEGIEAGADDYLAKPFEMGELLARARGLVRRAAGRVSPVIETGRLALDTRRMSATLDGSRSSCRRWSSACWTAWRTIPTARSRPANWPSSSTASPTPPTPTPSRPWSPACAARSGPT
jgi:two-component system OmpR family response regulator